MKCNAGLEMTIFQLSGHFQSSERNKGAHQLGVCGHYKLPYGSLGQSPNSFSNSDASLSRNGLFLHAFDYCTPIQMLLCTAKLTNMTDQAQFTDNFCLVILKNCSVMTDD